jgi:hypothetical protein
MAGIGPGAASVVRMARHQLAPDAGVDHRPPAQQLRRSGRRDRDPAVGPVDEAAAHRQRRGADRGGVEQPEADRGTGHVDDRVDRADVVEVDGVARLAVRARLRVGEPDEDALGGGKRGRIHLPRPEDPEHVAQRAVRVVMVVLVLDVHVHLGRAKSSAPDLAGGDRPAVERQRGELLPDRVERDARVDERAEDHVPGRAAGTVEVDDAAHRIFATRRLICEAWWAAPKPLSMLRTDTPAAHELSIASSAASPLSEVP